MLEKLRQRKSRFGLTFAMAAFFVGMAFVLAAFGSGGNVLRESAPVDFSNGEIVASAANENVIPLDAYQNQDAIYNRGFWRYTWQYDITSMYRITKVTGGEEIKTEVDFTATPKPIMVVGVYEVTVVPRAGNVFADDSPSRPGTRTFRLTVKPATIQWKFQNLIVTGYTNSSQTQMLDTRPFDPTMANSDYLKYNPREHVSATFESETGSSRTYSWSGVKQSEVSYTEAEAAEANRFFAWDLNREAGNQELPVKAGSAAYFWEAGDYKFTVCDPDNYTNPTLILRITPAEIDLAQYSGLHWITRQGTEGSELRSGTIYVYTYKDPNLSLQSEYYSANQLTSAPNATWQNWDLKESFTANFSIYGYREGISTHAIRLANDQTGNAQKAYYTAEYSGQYGGTDLGGDPITQSGKYVAYATLTQSRNYRFVYNPTNDTDIASRGLTVSTLANGTARVRKEWYVVHYNNMLLDVSGKRQPDEEGGFTGGEEIPYAIPSWTFGSYPTGGIQAPYLQHGDEWNKIDQNTYLADSWASGYSLTVRGYGTVSYNGETLDWDEDLEKLRDGEMDVVTFTLKRNGETLCADQMRSRWGYYFNRYMPAGEYEVIFQVLKLSVSARHNHWWNDELSTNCGTEFPAFSQSYRFTVSPCPISVNDEAFNAYNHAELKPFEVNLADLEGGYQSFFGVVNGAFSAVVTRSAVLASADSYWKTHAEEYFDEAPWLTFNLASAPDNTYYTADASEWSTLIAAANKYRVFYRSNMQNYLDPTEDAVLDKDARYKQYFEVLVYEIVELPVPVHTDFTYSGDPNTLTVETPNPRYVLSENTATVVGNYTAKFTLRNNADYPVYRWNGWDKDEYPCEFRVVPASVTLPSLGSPYYSGLPLYPDVRIPFGPTGAPLYQLNLLNLPVGQLGYVNKGNYEVELQLRDAQNYCWVDEQGKEISDVVNGKIKQEFIIKPAPNAWVDAVRLQGWEWGTFSNQLPSATAVSGAVRFTVTEDEAGLAPVAKPFTLSGGSLDEDTEAAMKALSAKTYYLWAEAVENDNYTVLEKTHCSFTVAKARNWWNVEPSVDRWAEGSTPKAPTAEARFGTPVVRVITQEGNECFYDSTQNINRLAEAKAGKYLLQYEVVGTDNYIGIDPDSREFTVYPAPNGGNVGSIWSLAPGIESWTEGETPKQPYGATVEDGVEIVYSYLNSNGTLLTAAPTEVGNYRLVAVAYRDGVEVARSEVSFEIKSKRDPMSGIGENGKMNGAMIALIVIVVILGVVGLGLGGVLGYLYMKKKGIAMPWERPKPVMPEIDFHYGNFEEKERENEELPRGPESQSRNDYYDED